MMFIDFFSSLSPWVLALFASVITGLSTGWALFFCCLFNKYHIALAFAAGAMLFVISHEIIPESHSRGNHSHATWGVMAGFILMFLLDVTLG